MRHSGFQMSFDGFDFSDLLTVESIRRPKTFHNATSDVAGRDGALWRNRNIESASIDVDVRLVARVSGRKNQRRALDGLEDRVMAALINKPDLCRLVLRDRPTFFDLASLDGSVEFVDMANTRAATLSFLCPSPASYGEWKEWESAEGKLEVLVDGSYKTFPTFIVEASGPFEIMIDGETFEVTGESTGAVVIDCENRATTHDDVGVSVSIYSDYPEWLPGIHVVECDLPYRVGFYERWVVSSGGSNGY